MFLTAALFFSMLLFPRYFRIMTAGIFDKRAERRLWYGGTAADAFPAMGKPDHALPDAAHIFHCGSGRLGFDGDTVEKDER